MKISELFLVLISSILLALSFPTFNLEFLIWVSFVPAFLALERAKSPVKAFGIFFLVGFFFYFVSIEWLRHVTYFGWIFVVCLLSFYFGIFGAYANFILSRFEPRRSLLILSCGWVVLEWVRTEIPTWACGGNLIGYSQSSVPQVLELAKWFGAYGISFAVLFINFALYLLLRWFQRKLSSGAAIFAVLASVFLLLTARSLDQFQPKIAPASSGDITVSVIQGNIPQDEKWDPEFKNRTIEDYKSFSQFAVQSKPDLIVWPESSWPDIFNRDLKQGLFRTFVQSMGTNFLIGSLYLEPRVWFGKPERLFNSAYLIDKEGGHEYRYDKIRLVPFGEFVPWAPLFRFLGLEKIAYSMGVGDFSAGSEPTIFRVRKNGGEFRFSTLICFEDIFPDLARRFVAKGAQFLVVITNDAWFGKSAAPYQHLQASIFRAVEQGVPVLRAANTGVSGFISEQGEVLGTVKDQFGNETWISGGSTMMISIKNTPTFYRQMGYHFPLVCLCVAGLTLVTFRSKPN